MNTKIPLRQLAESIAASSGKSPEEAMLFVKHLFSEVSDRLYNGESIEIDGLGTFSAVANTSEPVRFEPDKIFADEINAPFALFEPMALNDNISEEDLDNAVEQLEEIANDTADKTCEDPTEAIEALTIEQDQQPTATESAATDVPVRDLSQTPDTEISGELTQASASAEVSQHQASFDRNELTQTPETIDTGLHSAEEDDIEEETIAGQDTAAATPYIEEEEEEYVTYHNAPKSRFGLGFFLGFISGIVIAALMLATYLLFITNGSLDFFK